jgi:hypothetical protein
MPKATRRPKRAEPRAYPKLAREVKRYITSNAGARPVSVVELCKRFHVQRRTLYRKRIGDPT